MDLNPSRLFQRLIDEQVEVVIIGGFAAVVLGVPYVTQDIDLCYNPETTNIVRLERALSPLHPRLRVQGLVDEEAAKLPFQLDKRTLQQTSILTLQTDVTELDLMSNVPGIGDYTKVKSASTTVQVSGYDMQVLDLPALIASKQAAGRPKDLLLIPEIEAILRLREQE